MAVKDTTKATIARELALLLTRVQKTTELNSDYRIALEAILHGARTCVEWEFYQIPYEHWLTYYDENRGGEE